MSAPAGPVLAVWHYRDWLRTDGKWTMCGAVLPAEPVGVVVPCQPCMDEIKARREAKRAV